jgi:hypothetical protein
MSNSADVPISMSSPPANVSLTSLVDEVRRMNALLEALLSPKNEEEEPESSYEGTGDTNITGRVLSWYRAESDPDNISSHEARLQRFRKEYIPTEAKLKSLLEGFCIIMDKDQSQLTTVSIQWHGAVLRLRQRSDKTDLLPLIEVPWQSPYEDSDHPFTQEMWDAIEDIPNEWPSYYVGIVQAGLQQTYFNGEAMCSPAILWKPKDAGFSVAPLYSYAYSNEQLVLMRESIPGATEVWVRCKSVFILWRTY